MFRILKSWKFWLVIVIVAGIGTGWIMANPDKKPTNLFSFSLFNGERGDSEVRDLHKQLSEAATGKEVNLPMAMKAAQSLSLAIADCLKTDPSSSVCASATIEMGGLVEIAHRRTAELYVNKRVKELEEVLAASNKAKDVAQMAALASVGTPVQIIPVSEYDRIDRLIKENGGTVTLDPRTGEVLRPTSGLSSPEPTMFNTKRSETAPRAIRATTTEFVGKARWSRIDQLKAREKANAISKAEKSELERYRQEWRQRAAQTR